MKIFTEDVFAYIVPDRLQIIDHVYTGFSSRLAGAKPKLKNDRDLQACHETLQTSRFNHTFSSLSVIMNILKLLFSSPPAPLSYMKLGPDGSQDNPLMVR